MCVCVYMYIYIIWVLLIVPRRDGLVVSVSASHAVGRDFASRTGHTKDHHKIGTNCLAAWHAGRLVCGTVY